MLEYVFFFIPVIVLSGGLYLFERFRIHDIEETYKRKRKREYEESQLNNRLLKACEGVTWKGDSVSSIEEAARTIQDRMGDDVKVYVSVKANCLHGRAITFFASNKWADVELRFMGSPDSPYTQS